ncbi:uncharacterized protein LOC124920227 isoform X2 [Impatiens glandulifera]|uniref:uncharacterized protein LOC124920227 isoform X2 n=1 Tax=Impatiens glandulifera TaxID=253017 RepID=UPI001FB0B03C|nr:uncharacterized protein LOC124920227 isoform X2 [Impatiens glandulifera]
MKKNQVKKMDQPEIHIPQTEVTLGNNCVMQSMAELLDHHQYSHKQSKEDNSSEALDSEQSSDEEINGHDLMICVKESNHKTAIDQIYEALDAAPVEDMEARLMFPKRLGMFGKLQEVLQVEKERDLYFSNGLQAGAISDGCIDVKILSRSLEAKLSVCSCSTSLYKNVEHIERSEDSKPRKEADKRTLTIIFNSRVCNDVELEIGSSIRIHPPWREVQIPEKGEMVIMSTYFSRLSSD